MKNGLCAVILTHNEKEKIAKALDSVKDLANQLVIVDDMSDDDFLKLCKKIVPHCEIFRRELDDFATQKNFGISKSRYEWVLNLDADEEVTPKLAKEISQIVFTGSQFDAFSIRFTTLLFEKYLENHEQHIRLFRNNGTKFENSVHETLKIKGNTSSLRGTIIHNHWNGYPEWQEKLNKYAHAAALRDIRNGNDYSKPGLLFRMLSIPLINFIDGFLLKKRYRLGTDGFIHSLVGGSNAMRRFAIYYEIKYHNPELFKKEFCKEQKR